MKKIIVLTILILLTFVIKSWAVVGYGVGGYPKFKAYVPGTSTPLVGGLLYTCNPGTTCTAPGSTNIKNTYTDAIGTSVNTNPIVLDSNGEANVWLTGYTKFILQDSTGVVIWSVDNVPPTGWTALPTNATEVRTSSYPNITTAVAAIGSVTTTLICDSSTSVVADTSIQSTTLFIAEPACQITILPGVTLDNKGTYAVGDYRIFYGTGTVIFSGNKTEYVKPEWWGIDGVNDEVAIQKAANAHSRVLLSKAYATGATITPVSNNQFIGINNASITITTADDVFSAQGTKASHLSNIKFDGIKFIGQQSTVTKFGVDIRWVDNLTITNCETLNLKLCYIAELDTDTYAGISLSQIQSGAIITKNRTSFTKDENGNSHIMIRYMRDFVVSDNVLIGHTTGLGAGIYIFGGNCDPAGDGAYANLSGGTGRKAGNGVMNNNTLKYLVSGFDVAQVENVVVNGNSLYDTGESLWVGASRDVIFSNNTLTHIDNSALQTQGINENIVFEGNIVDYHSNVETGRILYIGYVWDSEYNVGPISFINNKIYSEHADYSTIYSCGHLIIKNNYFENIHLATLGKIGQLEIEGNKFIYDYFSSATYVQYALLYLTGHNSVLLGLVGSKNTYTTIKNNTWLDRTSAWPTSGTGRPITIGTPGTTSNLYIEGNTIACPSANISIMVAAQTLTVTDCSNNGSGLIRVTSASHGLNTGAIVTISDVSGTTEANAADWVITKVDDNKFDLVGSTYANPYISGGDITPVLSTFINNNKMSGAIDSVSQNTSHNAGGSHVYWKNNYKLNGQDVYGAAPATAGTDWFSVGSIVYSNDPASTGYIGWVCTVEGHPGTWATFGAVTP